MLWSQKADEGDRLVSGAGNMMSRFPFNQTPLYTSADEGMCSGISIVTQCWFLALRCVTSVTTYFKMCYIWYYILYNVVWVQVGRQKWKGVLCFNWEGISSKICMFSINWKVWIWVQCFRLICASVLEGQKWTQQDGYKYSGACQRIHPRAGIVSLIRGGHKGSGGPGVWVVNN